MKPSHILTLGRDAITPSQALVAANAIDADKRVDREIAACMAANDAQAAVEKAAHRANMKRIRESRRERGDVLLNLWADWRQWDEKALGYPPENILAKMMKRALTRPRIILQEGSEKPAEEYVRMTLVERQAHAKGMVIRIDNIIDDRCFPMAFRNVVLSIYDRRKKQDQAAVELALTQPEVSSTLQLAREHVGQQYDDLRLGLK